MSALERFLPHILGHPLHRALGLETIDAGQGRSRFEVLIGPDMVNVAGMFHGGIVYLLADLACFAAVLSELKDDEFAVTHDIHVSMLRAAKLGQRASFEARVLKLGRSVAFMEAQVRCGEELLARATVTKSILRTPV